MWKGRQETSQVAFVVGVRFSLSLSLCLSLQLSHLASGFVKQLESSYVTADQGEQVGNIWGVQTAVLIVGWNVTALGRS